MNLAKVNETMKHPRKWMRNSSLDGVEVVGLGIVLVLAAALIWLIIMVANWYNIDGSDSPDPSNHYNKDFAQICSTVGGHAVIGDRDECLVVRNGKTVVLFRESAN